ncbi:hypothetical protein AAAC51_22610 [Priestia megaterium]
MKRTGKGMIPFWDYIGIEETLLEKGYAELKITIQPQLLQGRERFMEALLPRLSMRRLVQLCGLLFLRLKVPVQLN